MDGDASTNGMSLDHLRDMIAAGLREAADLSGVRPRPVPPRDSVPGYEILSELGRGGMGVVYKAYQVSIKRTVALKVLLAGEFASPSARTRFQREVELTARLQHAGIVRVLENGLTSGGQQYYAMDYVQAVPLDRWLMLSQPDVRTTLATFIEICEAVDHAHHHGVIHRDLKPGNILIDGEGHPHILDFGLAQSSDHIEFTATMAASVSMPGQIVGTLRYLSPEQAAGKPEEIDARTDVYALGVMLFEALTGALPYDTTGHPSAVIQRIIEAPPTRPSSLSDRVNSELETIILKALEKERARRYQSARELGEDLGRYLRGEPILARPPSTLYRLRKKLSRHRRQTAIVAMASALVLMATCAMLWWRHHALDEFTELAKANVALEARRGDYKQAVEDCTDVLEAGRHLEGQADLYHLRGTAYLCLLEPDKAIDDFTRAARVCSTDVSKTWCLYPRATAFWIVGAREKAAADYREFHRANPGHLYSQARLFLVLRDQARELKKEDRAAEAKEAVKEAEEILAEAQREATTDAWLKGILECLAGRRRPAELVAGAEGRGPGALCEAYFYAGEACLLAGEVGQACDWFRRCMAIGMPIDENAPGAVPMNEWHLARWRLKTLTSDDADAQIATSQPSAAPSPQ